MSIPKKFDKTLLQNAYSWSEHSHSRRKKVAAVISKGGVVISNGYNGTSSGEDNNCENLCNYCNGTGSIRQLSLEDDEAVIVVDCKHCQGTGLITKPEVLHAEMNALMFALQEGRSTKGAELHVTLSPCFQCAKAIKQAGIIRVVYSEEYRDTSGVEYLKDRGVEVLHLDILREI